MPTRCRRWRSWGRERVVLGDREQGLVAAADWRVRRRTSLCTRRRPHQGFSGFTVSPAAAAGELLRSAFGVAMDDELTPEQKFAAEDAETMVPRALMEGRAPDDIIADLVRLDWSPPAAKALVARVADDLRRYHESPEARQQLLHEARTQFLAGLLLTLLALGLTAFTLLAALAGAMPFFVVAFGLFFGGLILSGRGWARWQLYRRTALPFGSPQQPSRAAERGAAPDPARDLGSGNS